MGREKQVIFSATMLPNGDDTVAFGQQEMESVESADLRAAAQLLAEQAVVFQ
jgi:hypothetical protein